MLRALLIFAISLFGFSASSSAQPQQSENFRVTKSVLDAGGGVSTSANFQLVNAFGQPTPVGVSSSANFILSAGFLSPIFSVSPLSPIQDLVIMRQPASNSMRLDWSAVPDAATYFIYRDSDPLFAPDSSNRIGTSATNGFVDVNAVNLPGMRYFYIIISSATTNPGAAGKQKQGHVKKIPAGNMR